MDNTHLTTRLLLTILVGSMTLLAVDDHRAEAATVIASYTAGHRDVTLNGYGTAGLGMFLLDTGDAAERAWCVEADVPHSKQSDAYAEVEGRADTPELDVLIWMLMRQDVVDDDTAAAAAALAWYYAGARRSIGPPVWSDGSRGFEPISPLAPEPWDALAPMSMHHPVGVRGSGVDLDSVERRVAELHRRATARRGPWQLAAGSVPGTFVVQGPGGPIVDAAVRITLQATGRPDTVVELRTDADGTAGIPVPALPGGGRVVAQMDSPGRHRAWDGSGDTQRMVTATTSVLTASAPIPSAPRFVEVHKTSDDVTLSPAGARFELRDADDRIVEAGRTGPDGRLVFSPIEPARHPAPYRIVETDPPPGLIAAPAVAVEDASVDPASPTVVAVVDHPAIVPITILKRLSVDGSGPADRSGFGFVIVRSADGSRHHVVTGPDGRTPSVALAVGDYRICEQEQPEWAAGLVDTGCRTVRIGPDDVPSSTEIEIEYVNEVPPPTIDTTARDLDDGDQQLPATGGVAVDRVSLAGLVPGTPYRLVGELVTATGTPVGVTGSSTLVASESTVEMELHLEVPPLPPGDYVIVQQLEIDDATATIVAVHDDLDDPDQTLTVLPPIPASTDVTTLSTTSTTSTTSTVSTSTAPPTTVPSTTVPSATWPDTTGSVPSTLPRTGGDRTAATVLRLADTLFVTGVGLSALAGWGARRRGSGGDPA